MTTPQTAASFYRVTEFYSGPTLKFLAITCGADGGHAGRGEGSAARDEQSMAHRDGQGAGLKEWPNPYARG